MFRSIEWEELCEEMQMVMSTIISMMMMISALLL